MAPFATALVLVISLVIISTISYFSYKKGMAHQAQIREKNNESITASILGLLSLFLSFTFSMVVHRYEQRRELAIAEANAISAAYTRLQFLKESPGINIKDLYVRYIDTRLDFYKKNLSRVDFGPSLEIKHKIIDHMKTVTLKERGALESAYSFALTDMFETGNERSWMLIKTLPPPIYVIILMIACFGFSALNYDRGFKEDNSHYRAAIYIAIFCLLYTLIFDLDHSNTGIIQISQDAMYELRKSL